jgi:hypothetical protein
LIPAAILEDWRFGWWENLEFQTSPAQGKAEVKVGRYLRLQSQLSRMRRQIAIQATPKSLPLGMPAKFRRFAQAAGRSFRIAIGLMVLLTRG